MGAFIDLTGHRSGRLVVLSQAAKSKGRNLRWLCLCDCGKELVCLGHNMRNGTTTSCGCYRLETTAEIRAKYLTKHGKRHTAEYYVWRGAKSRCFNPKDKAYKNYGGRGITMCAEWRNSFKAFFLSMGPRPSGKHSIDRFPNNDGNYEPGNVRWATCLQHWRKQRRSL
jgi:hypothetical protein